MKKFIEMLKKLWDLMKPYVDIKVNPTPEPTPVPIPIPTPVPPDPEPAPPPIPIPPPDPDQPPHDQATVNLLFQSPFNGQTLNPTYWANLEAFCKAGPTQLILADMDQIPNQMSQAGFTARESCQYYCLSRTVSGANWSPYNGDGVLDGEAKFLYDNIPGMNAWWDRYIQTIVQIMQKALQTTAVIIINDYEGADRGGRSLGRGTHGQMSSVIDRVSMGDTAQD